MNYQNEEIEHILKQAPSPVAPGGLKERLVGQANVPLSQNRPQVSGTGNVRPEVGWLRRWWAVLVPGMVSLAGAVVLTLQQSQISNLQTTVETLRQGSGDGKLSAASARITGQMDNTVISSAEDEQREIERLKKVAAQLSSAVAAQEQLQAENQKLRAQIAASSTRLPPEIQGDIDLMAKAKEKAQMINCVNNLKQIGLAFRIWANDNNDRYPSTVPYEQGGAMLPGGAYSQDRVFQVVSNEFSTPKILVCAGDTNRLAASNWASFTSLNLSYQYVGGTASETEPTAVLAICPIHGTVLLCDGSVQMEAYKTHPEKFVQQDGKLYFGTPPTTQPTPRIRGRRGGPTQGNP
jgi:hypothetical protein